MIEGSPPASRGYIGRRQRRINGAQILAGRLQFTADEAAEDLLQVVVVRSPVAHAVIRSVDTSAARNSPGVRLAVTGADLVSVVDPIPPFIDPRARGAKYVDIRCLATERVSYVGQPIAAVVADSLDAAHAAAGLVVLDLEERPAILDADNALADGSPLVYPEWGDNVLMSRSYGLGHAETALAGAQYVLEGELYLQRCTTAPIEPRACVARWNRDEGTLRLQSTCQNPHVLRKMVARALGMRETDVRVFAPAVGGSFGLKMAGHPEDVLVAVLTRMLGAPVRWVEDRETCLMHGGREQRHRYRVGFQDDGRIVAFEDKIVADVGSATSQAGWGMPNLTALTLPSGYDIQASDVELLAVVTNKPPLAAARGFGKDGAVLVIERALDQVASALGADPADVRRLNFIPSGRFPYRTAGGLNVDSGDYSAVLDLALEAVGYGQQRARQQSLRAQGRYLGIGLAFELTPESADGAGTEVTGFDTSTVRIDPSGSVTVLTGVTTPGGGNETGIAQIVADELGVPIDVVRVVQGDTDRTPYGFGNFSGRGTLTGGGSAALAARDLRARLLDAAALMLGQPPESLAVADGFVVSGDAPHSERQLLPLSAVATTIATSAFQAIGDLEPLLEATRAYRPGNIDQQPDEYGRIQPYPTYSNAVLVAVLEVDLPTGLVCLEHIAVAHDCGTMINPALVEAQMHGAIAMGIGLALSENLRFGPDGRLTSDGFKRYRLPRASDMPRITIAHHVTPSPFTLFGNKGAGEAGVGGAAAAIVNGVADALAPLGFMPSHLPLDPPTILQGINAATPRARHGV